jgi:hypothetical protein
MGGHGLEDLRADTPGWSTLSTLKNVPTKDQNDQLSRHQFSTQAFDSGRKVATAMIL